MKGRSLDTARGEKFRERNNYSKTAQTKIADLGNWKGKGKHHRFRLLEKENQELDMEMGRSSRTMIGPSWLAREMGSETGTSGDRVCEKPAKTSGMEESQGGKEQFGRELSSNSP